MSYYGRAPRSPWIPIACLFAGLLAIAVYIGVHIQTSGARIASLEQETAELSGDVDDTSAVLGNALDGLAATCESAKQAQEVLRNNTRLLIRLLYTVSRHHLKRTLLPTGLGSWWYQVDGRTVRVDPNVAGSSLEGDHVP